MKTRINEVKVKYIQCPECDFERSFLLQGEIKHGTFAWFCPKCGCFLIATIDKNEVLQNVRKGGNEVNTRQVIITLPIGIVPFSMFFSFEENVEKTDGGDLISRRVEPKLLLLQPEAPDAEINPQGLPQYRTIIV